MDYATLKIVHVSAVALSGVGFIARGAGALRGAAWVRGRAARTLPHLIDTILLLSAIGMLWTIHLWPWGVPWLRAKIIGLFLYIGFGVIAMRGLRARAAARPAALAPHGAAGARLRRVPLAAWVLAVLLFLYIVSVALTKSPWGAFSLL